MVLSNTPTSVGVFFFPDGGDTKTGTAETAVPVFDSIKKDRPLGQH